MNSKAKGDKAELEVQKILEKDGFLVQRAWRKMIRLPNGRWVSKTNDFFGCFDIMAIPATEEEEVIDPVKLIQVTTENELGTKRTKIRETMKNNYTVCYEITIWCRIKEKNKVKYRVYEYPNFLKKDSYVVDK